MTSGELLLSLGLVAFMLYSNLGVKSVTRHRFLRPVVILGAVGYTYVAGMPTGGNDVPFALLGAVTRVEVIDGRIVTRAGAAFAAIWISVMGARIAFAEGATHVFPDWVA